MTVQLRNLLLGESAICFVGWIILGIMQSSPFLLICSILVAFFVLVMDMKSYKACASALVLSIGFSFFM